MRQFIRLSSSIFVSFFLVVIAINFGGASSASWITDTLTLQEQKTYTLPQDNLDVSSITGNKIPCQKESFIAKPKKMNGLITLQAEQRANVCSYGVTAGRFGNGYLLKNGHTTAGAIKSTQSTSSYILPIPGSSKVLEFISGGGIAWRMYIIDDAYSGIVTTTNAATGVVTHTLPPPTTQNVKNSRGDPLFIDTNTIALSDNGQWMIADGLSTGFVRINLATGEVLPFTTGFSNAVRNSVVFSMNAVSNDGKQVVVSAMAPLQVFTYYDLNSCTAPVSGMIYSCKSRNLQTFINTQRNKYSGGTTKVDFINNDLLQFYASYEYIAPNNRKIGLFSLGTTSESLTKVNYIALGDSFSSGEGAYNYRPETNTDTNRCHQSFLSYPYLLHTLLTTTGNFRAVTCSGAKIKDITLIDLVSYNRSSPQATGKEDKIFDSEIENSFLPGYRAQLKFIGSNKPQTVTMSMGGNDIGFSSIIAKCVTQVAQDCYHYYEDRKELVNNINSQYPQLLRMYQSLQQSAATDAKIYIIGYPQIAKADGDCAINVHFSNTEVIFGNQLINYLNSVIKKAADAAGVYYVDVEGAFVGHRLCEATTNDIAVNGLTFGRGGPVLGYPLATESYHPNALGHQLFADTIAVKTGGLTAVMPQATNAEPVFAADADIPLLATAPKENRTVLPSQYNAAITDDVLYKDTLAKITADAQDYSLKPSSSFSVVMYSDPTELGTVTSDANGSINANISLPADIEPGYHTLHIRGKNSINDDIDLQKIVYVAATQNDIDGDGIPNTSERCLGVEPAGIDIDKDGLDDACDEFIDKPPPEPAQDPTPIPLPLPEKPIQNPTNPQVPAIPTTPIIIEPPAKTPAAEVAEELLPAVVLKQEIVATQTPASTLGQPTPAAQVAVRQSVSAVGQATSPVAQVASTINQPITNVAGIEDINEETSAIRSNSNNGWVVIIISIFILAGIFLSLMTWAKK